MAMKTKYHLKAKVKDAYLELVLAFPLTSIQSEEHLQAAQEVMDRLLAAGDLEDGAMLYLDALSDLVGAIFEFNQFHSKPLGYRPCSRAGIGLC